LASEPLKTASPASDPPALHVLHRVEDGLLVLVLALATLFPLLEAVGRMLGRSLVTGSAAYVQQLMLWTAFLGAVITTREGKHLTLSTVEFMPEGRFRRLARLLTGSLAAATAAILAYASWELVKTIREENQVLPVGLPVWVSEMVMPVALAVIALRLAWLATDRMALRAVPLLAVAAAFGLGLVPEKAAEYAWPIGLLVLGVFLLGAPIFAGMGALALLFFFKDATPVAAVTVEVHRLIASPTLPAIPLLTIAGYVLAEGRASERLLRFFRALFGWMPGGLAVMVTAVCALFTTFTGGSGVTIIAVGGLVYPMLLKDGYPRPFSLGLVTAAGSLGLLFPPSLPVILYSVVASNTDVPAPADALYLAGVVPGLLMAALVAGYGVVVGRNAHTERQPFAAGELGRAAWGAKWELGLPVFVIGLFGSGLASTVETAAAAVVYAIVTQCLVLRDVGLRRQLPHAVLQSGVLMGAILLLLAVAMGLTSYLVDAQIAQALLEWVTTHIHSKLLFLLALNVILLIVGCLVDIFSAIVVVVPLIAPLGAAFGVDPVHLGIIFLANLELGFLTPPVGMNLFLSSSRFETPLLRVYRDTLPFLLLLTAAVLVITYVPELSLALPRALGRGGAEAALEAIP
jgi:C4-dicarboxylate transporter DctM subunit